MDNKQKTPKENITISTDEMIANFKKSVKEETEKEEKDATLGQLDCIDKSSFEGNIACEKSDRKNAGYENINRDTCEQPNKENLVSKQHNKQSLAHEQSNDKNVVHEKSDRKNTTHTSPRGTHKNSNGNKHLKEDSTLFTNDFLMECAWAKDKGNGILYSHLFNDRFACLGENDSWLEYGGHFWQKCDISRVQNSVETVVNQYKNLIEDIKEELKIATDEENKSLMAYLESKKKTLKTSINTLHTVGGVSSCLTFSKANDKTTVISSDLLDANLHVLCCDNGLIDLRTGECREGTPKDYITRTCKGKWKSLEEPAPLFEKMVHEIFGEKEEVTHYFHKLIGMAMCGVISEKIFIILLGEDGDSGKTTIFETLFDVVRGYVSPMPVEMLLDQRNPKNPDSPTPSIMSLCGQRLCWASEPGENRRFSIENIKLMSGNDSLTGRNPWDKSMSSFTPTHTLFLLTNHKMRASAHDQAFWSRLRLIECPFNFVTNPDPSNPRHRKRIDGLRQKIVEEEKAGILAWIVRGYMHYIAEGIEPPEDVKESTAKYRREEDIMEDFIEACLEKVEVESSIKEDVKRIGASDLYELFKNWFMENLSKNVMSGTSFGRMAAKRIEKGKVGGKVYYFGYMITEEARGQYAKS